MGPQRTWFLRERHIERWSSTLRATLARMSRDITSALPPVSLVRDKYGSPIWREINNLPMRAALDWIRISTVDSFISSKCYSIFRSYRKEDTTWMSWSRSMNAWLFVTVAVCITWLHQVFCPSSCNTTADKIPWRCELRKQGSSFPFDTISRRDMTGIHVVYWISGRVRAGPWTNNVFSAGPVGVEGSTHL